MAVTVTPSIIIDGRKVACTAAELETAPVAVKSFTVHWGREEYSATGTEPASVTITLLDTTGTWSRRVRESRAIGVPMRIEWTGTATGGRQIGPVVMFRGRVQHVECRPHTLTTTDGRTAWTVELDCSDPTSVMGNAIAPADTWPPETMTQRAAKILALGIAAGSEIDQLKFWDGHRNDRTAPLDVNNTTALDLMNDFYESMSNETWAYDPETNTVRQAIRLSQEYTTHLATFDDSLGAVLPVASDITWDGQDFPGIGLGGCQLEGTPAVTADPSTDINRVEVGWKNADNEFKDDRTVKENVPPGNARRVMSWSSWLAHGYAINPTVANVFERAREEGRRPRHPVITVHAGKEFVSERVARWLLATWENIRPAFISGNAAFQWLLADTAGYAPVVAPIGGETTWEPSTGWHARLNVHWVHNKTPASERPATWKSLQQIRVDTTQPSYPWWYPLVGIKPPPPVSVGTPTPERDLSWGETGYHFHSSVTWGDLQHVAQSGTQVKDILT